MFFPKLDQIAKPTLKDMISAQNQIKTESTKAKIETDEAENFGNKKQPGGYTLQCDWCNRFFTSQRGVERHKTYCAWHPQRLKGKFF